MFIFKMTDEIYTLLVSLLLFIILKPIIKISRKIFFYQKYENFCYFLITCINYLYPLQRYRALKNNEKKYDIETYQKTYDKEGINLYFKYFNPEEVIKDKEILDFGCGVGGKDFELLKYSPKKIIGIDLSQRNIKYAKKIIKSSSKKFLFFENKNLLDFKENKKFDVIISYTVFEHVERRFLLEILNKMYDLLKDDGIIIIVFNHYNDRFGMHLKEYIYHPWPQTLFEEYLLYKYWNEKFKKDKNINKNSYFPRNYKHGITNYNNDCFMNLNKISIAEFEKIINKTKLSCFKKHFYSKSFLLKILPFLPKKYLLGSVVYYLRKSE